MAGSRIGANRVEAIGNAKRPADLSEDERSALVAHRAVVNGARSLRHDSDSARSLFSQAHGMASALQTLTVEAPDVLPAKLYGEALRGIETLIELGLRDLEAHDRLGFH